MGRLKKEPTIIQTYRVKPEVAEKLKETALELGFKYGDTAAMGAFLERLSEVDRELLKLIFKKN
jgi:hypothetical protein